LRGNPARMNSPMSVLTLTPASSAICRNVSEVAR
jgi:hypothetical protein